MSPLRRLACAALTCTAMLAGAADARADYRSSSQALGPSALFALDQASGEKDVISGLTMTGSSAGTSASFHATMNSPSLSFAGVNKLKAADAIDLSQDFTVSFWAAMTPTSGTRVLFSAGPTNNGMHVTRDGNGTLQLRIGVGKTVGVAPDGSGPTPDGWHHITLVRRDATVELWRDGYIRSGASAQYTTTTRTSFSLGGYDQALTGNYRGDLDELAVYPRALTAQEIYGQAMLGSDHQPPALWIASVAPGWTSDVMLAAHSHETVASLTCPGRVCQLTETGRVGAGQGTPGWPAYTISGLQQGGRFSVADEMANRQTYDVPATVADPTQRTLSPEFHVTSNNGVGACALDTIKQACPAQYRFQDVTPGRHRVTVIDLADRHADFDVDVPLVAPKIAGLDLPAISSRSRPPLLRMVLAAPAKLTVKVCRAARCVSGSSNRQAGPVTLITPALGKLPAGRAKVTVTASNTTGQDIVGRDLQLIG